MPLAMNTLLSLLLPLTIQAAPLPDCTITYRYLREENANYYEVFAAEQTLELKSEPDYGCITPGCAAERAVKIEREGQCTIRRGHCETTYNTETYRHGALKIRWNRHLMALLVGTADRSVAPGSIDANETQKILSDTGFCRW